MSRENAGYIVKTKSGKIGRTYHNKGMVNGKIPVYLAAKKRKQDGCWVILEEEKSAILCDPKTLKGLGFID